MSSAALSSFVFFIYISIFCFGCSYLKPFAVVVIIVFVVVTLSTEKYFYAVVVLFT